MYLIVEGMPASGKTTLAKALADKYQAAYFKSLLPDDDIGNIIRTLRDSGRLESEVNLLHLTDLYRNELAIRKLLDAGQSVIRDKCFLSSLAHILSVTETIPAELREITLKLYQELYSCMTVPDAVILLDRTLTDSREKLEQKQDQTSIDQAILGDKARFSLQRQHLFGCAGRYFPDNLILLDGSETIDEELAIVSSKVRKP